MILTCPECATSYFVDDGKIPPTGRSVRCANCGARWTATPDEPDLELTPAPAPDAAAEAPTPPEPEAVATGPAAAGDALPKVFRARADTERKVRQAATLGVVWAAAAAALVLLAALAVVFRADVVRMWPRSAAAYAGLGMPVNSLGLVLEAVKAEPALKGGHAALSISGQIRNIQDREVTSPPLKISLLNKAGKPVATQVAHAADPRIPSGETRHFAITMLDPPSTANDLEVTFAPQAAKPKARPKPEARPEPKPAAKSEAAPHKDDAASHKPDPHAAAPAKPAAMAVLRPQPDRPADPGLRPAAEPPRPPLPPPVEARPLPADSPYALAPAR